MKFFSDNAAAVHPRVWDALRAADAPQPPYDNDALSQRMDEVFADLFGRPCAVLWVATGTAANCLALAAMVPPHGGVICHREAHIETDEGGAPGFYTHGAKLILAEGEGARLTPEGIAKVADVIVPLMALTYIASAQLILAACCLATCRRCPGGVPSRR